MHQRIDGIGIGTFFEVSKFVLGGLGGLDFCRRMAKQFGPWQIRHRRENLF